MTPEGAVLKSILEYLAVKRIWCLRMNTGAIPLSNGKKSRFIRFGTPGCADILAAPYVSDKDDVFDSYGYKPCFLWLEVKAKGKQSPDQIRFMDEVREQGHYYAVVRSIEDVEEVLKEITQ